MRRSLFLVFAALVAVVLLFVGAGEDPESAAPLEEAAQPLLPDAAAAAVPTEQVREVVGTAPAATLPVAVGLEREPEAPVEETLGVRLELVATATGAPCPRALVFVLDTDALDYETYRTEIAGGGDRRLAMARFGRCFQADDDGIAVVPAPVGDLAVRATFEDQIAQLTLKGAFPGQRRRVELAEATTVHVRVVNEVGEPVADVPVELRGWRDDWHHGLAVRATDADGLVELPEVASLIREEGTEDRRFTVSLDLPLAESVDRDLDVADLPTEPIVLTLPPTGSLEVRLFGVEGKPVHEPTHVNLAVDPQPDADSGPWGWNRRIAGRLLYGANAVSQDGVARFPHVGLGLDFRAAAAVNGTQDMDQGKGAGPKQAGDETVIEIRPDTRRRVITGRLIEPDGRPTGRHRLLGCWLSEKRLMQYWNYEGAATDSSGRFRISLADDLQYPATLVLQVPAADRREPPVEARVDLPAEPPPGITELGDLPLTVAPLLAEGQVRFLDGRGASGAEIRVNVEMEFYNSTAWTELRERAVRADAAGWFRLYGALPGFDQAQLFVQHVNAPIVKRLFQPGEAGIEVLLEPSGSLAGSFLFHPSLDPATLRFRLIAKGTGDRPRTFLARIEPDGTWKKDSLPLGDMVLRLGFEAALPFAQDGDSAVWRREIRLEADQDAGLPDLQNVDLQHLRMFRVRLRNEDGEPISDGMVLNGAAETFSPLLRADRNGVVALPTWLDVETWRASARGYLGQELGKVEGDLDVVLQAAIPVLFRFQGATLPDGATLQIRSYERERRRFELGSFWYFDANGTCTIYYQQAGTYVVGLDLRLDGVVRSASLEGSAGITPTQITVHEGRLGQEQLITVPQSVIDAAVAKLQAED